MTKDDTRYAIVTKRIRVERNADCVRSELDITADNVLESPGIVAQGSKTIPVNKMHDQIAAAARARDVAPAVEFAGTDIVIENIGDNQIAIVLPGALRLTGTREEALALAATLVRGATR